MNRNEANETSVFFLFLMIWGVLALVWDFYIDVVLSLHAVLPAAIVNHGLWQYFIHYGTGTPYLTAIGAMFLLFLWVGLVGPILEAIVGGLFALVRSVKKARP